MWKGHKKLSIIQSAKGEKVSFWKKAKLEKAWKEQIIVW